MPFSFYAETTLLTTEECDLYYKAPVPLDIEGPFDLTFGDLHGNGLSLLYTLIEKSILRLKPFTPILDILWKKFSSIYRENMGESEASETLFYHDIKALLSVLEVNPDFTGKIRFIGDVFADRGRNDAFQLLIFEMLHKAGVNYKICLGNHDVSFLQIIFGYIHNFGNPDQYCSITNAMKSPEINKELLSEGFIQEIVFEHMILFDCNIIESTDEKRLELFCHAPNGLNLVWEMMSFYGVSTTAISFADFKKDNKAISLAIELINVAFLTKGLPAFLDDYNISIPLIERTISNAPLFKLVWNKTYDNCILATDMTLIHGHYARIRHHPFLGSVKLVNLDSAFGGSLEHINGRRLGGKGIFSQEYNGDLDSDFEDEQDGELPKGTVPRWFINLGDQVPDDHGAVASFYSDLFEVSSRGDVIFHHLDGLQDTRLRNLIMHFVYSPASPASPAVIRNLLNQVRKYDKATPMDYFARHRDQESIKFLLALGVDINSFGARGLTPCQEIYQTACMLSKAEQATARDFIKMLLDTHKANLNAPSKFGVRLLDMAILNGDHEMVRFLVEVCKVNVDDNDKLPKGFIDEEIAKYLRSSVSSGASAGAGALASVAFRGGSGLVGDGLGYGAEPYK